MSKKMQSIAGFMQEDHRRLDRLFRDFQAQKKVEPLSAFITGLKRHIIIEEEILFPVFEKKTGSRLGPTEVMRTEHRTIRDLLSKIHETFAGNRDIRKVAEELAMVLGSHNDKEENVLYPWIDKQLTAPEQEEAFKKIHDLPPGIEGSCCPA